MIFLLTLLLFAQSDLPTYGKIEQLKGLRRVYVASASEDSRTRIIKALEKEKNLQVVNSPEKAQFFLSYEELSREAAVKGRLIGREQRSQMRAYLQSADGRKTVVWSEDSSRETEHLMGMTTSDSGRGESELTKKFLKELKKARAAR